MSAPEKGDRVRVVLDVGRCPECSGIVNAGWVS